MINYYHGATLALIITLNPSEITTRVNIKVKGLYGIVAKFEGHRVIPAMHICIIIRIS
jgi:hypothetical protein